MAQTTNRLRAVEAQGQSIWIDFISRGPIPSGHLARLIAEDGVSGVTSNPAIFEKAIAGTHDYDSEIARLATAGRGVEEILCALTVGDIRDTADLLRPTYDESD